ncbi:MAG: AAA family ATPase [Pseudomonadota bacterium]
MLTARAKIETARQEIRYMPINLKGVLARVGISQEQWAGAITQTGTFARGKPLSLAAAAQILNWNQWPKQTPKEHIKRQTEDMLRGMGVPDEVLKTIWREDIYNEFRHMHPVGAHARKKAPLYQSEVPAMEVEMLSAAAKKHFQMFKDPFIDDVQTSDDVFLSTEQRYIREAMYTTAKHGGFLAIVGESGSGKTTLRRDLLDRISRESLQIVCIQPRTIDKAKLSSGAICEAIIRDLSQERPRQTLEGKARQVEKILVGSSRAGNSHVLLIEEAHDLSISTLKYLKRFWELEDGFKKLLAIILVGQPELKGMLDERMNYEAREVIRRCEIAELLPLNGNLEEYLELKFRRIGKKLSDVFDKTAYDAIRTRLTVLRRGANKADSMLYPLVVNNLVTKAMNLCAEIRADKINADVVKEI